jgi:hypothetical protein
MVNDRLIDAVMEFVAANPKSSRSAVLAAVQCRRQNVLDTLHLLTDEGRLVAHIGPHSTHYEVAS